MTHTQRQVFSASCFPPGSMISHAGDAGVCVRYRKEHQSEIGLSAVVNKQLEKGNSLIKIYKMVFLTVTDSM